MKRYKVTIKIEKIMKDGELPYIVEESEELNERKMFKLRTLWDHLKIK
jgi:hypothetical protein